MCGRFVLVEPDLDELRRYLPIDDVLVDHWTPRYNIAPSQMAPVLRIADNGRSRVELLQWGLLRGDARDPSVQRPINARVESLHQRAAFRRSYGRRHCVVPASGYYEWQKIGAHKQPWLIAPPSGILAMAGLWDRWLSREGEVVETFAIVTTDAPASIARIHSRAPLVLDSTQASAWLRCHLDLPVPEETAPELRVIAVSTRVNKPDNDDPTLLEPVAVPEAPQLALDFAPTRRK